VYRRSVASGDPSVAGDEVSDGAKRLPVRRPHLLLRVWCISFVIFVALGWLWSISTPLTTGPDEATQIIRAAAVVRGEWYGQPNPGHGPASRLVIVPEFFRNLSLMDGCFAHSSIPPSCSRLLGGSSQLVVAKTYVGRYPPLYYLLVGGPSLIASDTASAYAMRLLSVLVSSVFLALAVAFAALFAEGSLALVGILVAITPFVLYITSVVEPSGMEISSALCLWSCIALVCTRPERPPPRALVNGAGCSAIVLGLTRAASPLWVISIAIVGVGFLLPLADIRKLWRLSRVRRWLLAVAVGNALAAAWTLVFKAYLVIPKFRGMPRSAGVATILAAEFHRSGLYLAEMVQSRYPHDGQVGQPVLILAWVLVGVVVLVGAVCATRRQRLVLAVIAVGTLLLPFVAGVLSFRKEGIVWQGRYSLPFAVGLPVIAAAGTSVRRLRAAGGKVFKVSAVTTAVVALSLLAQLGSLYGLLRNFTVGSNGSLNFVFEHTRGWSPPLPLPLVVFAAAAVSLLAIVWFATLVQASSRAGPPPDPDGEETPQPKGGLVRTAGRGSAWMRMRHRATWSGTLSPPWPG
jgi:hypothetical protein